MRRLAALLFALALAGCGSGPDGDVLKKDVGERLAQALPAGTVSLATFDRRGSQADTKAPAGETRRIVYFDTALKLDRDFDFGAWDSPGVAGVVSALGAGPKGLTGITSGGNRAGDVIRGHGTALYKRDGDRWVPVASAGYQPANAPAYATNAPQGASAILDAMRKVIESVPKDGAPGQRRIIEEELTAAHAAIRARLARAQDGYAIAAGPEHGQYLRFALALADGEGARTVPLVTLGGEENLQLLREGKVSLALAQGDAALQAYEGKGNFAAAGPHPALRAIGSLYPEPVHVLMRAEGAVASVADLKGRRVAIGQRGSASRTTALRVLAAHGLGVGDIKPLELGLGDALVALREKEADAVIQVIGVPADAIRDALIEVPLALRPARGARGRRPRRRADGVLRVHDSAGCVSDPGAGRAYRRDRGAAPRRRRSLRVRGRRGDPLRLRAGPRLRGARQRPGHPGVGGHGATGPVGPVARRGGEGARSDGGRRGGARQVVDVARVHARAGGGRAAEARARRRRRRAGRGVPARRARDVVDPGG